MNKMAYKIKDMTNEELIKEYPIQDDIWASRRWNNEMTDYVDLSGHEAPVSGSLLVSELEEFWYKMGEDWHLWDEEEQGQYPIQRVFDAMKKFVEHHK